MTPCCFGSSRPYGSMHLSLSRWTTLAGGDHGRALKNNAGLWGRRLCSAAPLGLRQTSDEALEIGSITRPGLMYSANRQFHFEERSKWWFEKFYIIEGLYRAPIREVKRKSVKS